MIKIYKYKGKSLQFTVFNIFSILGEFRIGLVAESTRSSPKIEGLPDHLDSFNCADITVEESLHKRGPQYCTVSKYRMYNPWQVVPFCVTC